MLEIYCLTITPRALRLIRRFDGDVTGNLAILCNYTNITASRDKRDHIVEDCFRVTYPNHEAIIYNLEGAIAFALSSYEIPEGA